MLPVVVNGAAGALIVENGQLVTVMGFTVSGGKIVEIERIADPEILRRIDLAALAERRRSSHLDGPPGAPLGLRSGLKELATP